MSGDALAVRLLAIFVEELDEQVVQMGNDLTALGRTPGDAERLRSIFRVMHTLKGASRAAGVPLIEQLCHVLESGLAQAKERATPLSADQLALLVESVDALADARERLAAGLPVAGATLASLIQRARGGAGAGRPEAGARAATPPIPPAPVPSRQTETPSAAPAPLPTDSSAPRDESMRISVSNVEAIASATGELAVLASCLVDHADDMATLRARLREQLLRLTPEDARIVDSAFATLVRRAGADARALDAIHGRLDDAVRHVRQRPLRELTDVVERVARDTARELDKQVRVTTTGSAIEADRVVLEALREPLLHLVRNAVDHGLESPAGRRAAGKAEQGEIAIHASLRGDRLRLLFGDDGAGIDAASIRRRSGVRQGAPLPADADELLRIIFDDGFSTRESATTLSGRGVGLSIVRVAVERLGGTVDVTSAAGKGMTFLLDVPLSVATMRALLVRVGDVTIALPSAFVSRVQRVPASALARVDGRDMLVVAGAPLPIVALATLLGPPYRAAPWAERLQVVILEVAAQRIAVTVDDLLDERELVLRPLDHVNAESAHATVGSAVIGAGEVVLVLSVPALVTSATQRAASSTVPGALPRIRPIAVRPLVLVVDDSITSRTLEHSVLMGAGYDVTTAVDGIEAWDALQRTSFALVVSDVEMPRLDGIGLCERMRADGRTARIPVILVTSLDQPEHRARGLEAGADAYITKSSFDQQDLLDTVRVLLGRPPELAP